MAKVDKAVEVVNDDVVIFYFGISPMERGHLTFLAVQPCTYIHTL